MTAPGRPGPAGVRPYGARPAVPGASRGGRWPLLMHLVGIAVVYGAGWVEVLRPHADADATTTAVGEALAAAVVAGWALALGLAVAGWIWMLIARSPGRGGASLNVVSLAVLCLLALIMVVPVAFETMFPGLMDNLPWWDPFLIPLTLGTVLALAGTIWAVPAGMRAKARGPAG